MRRHRRRGNVYAQAGDESDENDSPPSDGPPSVTKRTLLLVHEWPVGSVVDFVHVIPILTQPQCLYGPRKPPSKKDNFIEDKGQDEDVPSCMAFDVVAPSLPGFGWSDAVINNKDANQNAFDALAAGRVLLTLMDQLNITEYWIHVSPCKFHII
jgi:pimeloyl-ACP methyl ester carboxylesterase